MRTATCFATCSSVFVMAGGIQLRASRRLRGSHLAGHETSHTSADGTLDPSAQVADDS